MPVGEYRYVGTSGSQPSKRHGLVVVWLMLVYIWPINQTEIASEVLWYDFSPAEHLSNNEHICCQCR